jgi:hypothetical protein
MTSETSGDGANGVADRIRGVASTQLSNQKERATDGLSGLSSAIRQSTQTFRDQHQDTMAGWVEAAADRIDRLSQHLRERDIGDLTHDVERFARRQPAAFLGVTFMAGVLAARFLKSSANDTTHRAAVPRGPMPAAGLPATGGVR